MRGGGRVSSGASAAETEIQTQTFRRIEDLGVLPLDRSEPKRLDSTILELPGTSAYVYATLDGIFEPFHANGTAVQSGQPAGRIHCTWDPARPPEVLHYAADGILYGRRQPGRVRPGNCCLVVAAPYSGVLES